VHIRRLRVAGYADRPDPPFATQAKPQHHDQWQRQAVRAQLHGLPTRGPIPQLPAIGDPAQAAEGLWVFEQDLSG
jgi:hypothetical protein